MLGSSYLHVNSPLDKILLLYVPTTAFLLFQVYLVFKRVLVFPFEIYFVCPFKRGSVYNGNSTEWSPIWYAIIRVINKIGRPRIAGVRSGGPICLIMSMITDRIGRHEILLPINHTQ